MEMSTYDELVERAARVLLTEGFEPIEYVEEAARAVLDAVADDLRAEGWDAALSEIRRRAQAGEQRQDVPNLYREE